MVEIVQQYQEIFDRQITGAFEQGKMDGDAYKRFAAIECDAVTPDEVYGHFDRLFKELAEYYQERLRERIYKGAQLLDSMGKDHPKYKQYMALYDQLCEDLGSFLNVDE